MNIDDKVKIYNLAIDTWGSRAQCDMATEECAEFIQALNKLRRAKSDNFNERMNNLIEEIADGLKLLN